MNLLFSCIGRRGYIADYFRPHLKPGDRIIGTSNTRWTPGFASCDAGIVLPPIEDAEYIPSVLDLCRRENISGLLSFFDPDVYRLSAHREELVRSGVVPIIPGLATAEICFDKWRTFEFLTTNGFATARTYIDLESAISALRRSEVVYPLYVKPRRGFGSRNVLLASNEQQLRAFVDIERDMLIQECLEGDAFDFELLADLESRVISVIPWRKHLSKMGETERAETVDFPELVDEARQLGELLAFVGPTDADVLVSGDKLSVLELNPRFGGGYPVSHLAGADFPAKIVKMIRGETISQNIGYYQRGMIMIKQINILGGTSDTLNNKVLNVKY